MIVFHGQSDPVFSFNSTVRWYEALDRNTGKVLWTDGSPGLNILHGQWSSPTYFEIDGKAQVVFGGGDGWIYSFDPKGAGGKAKLLWKFDANPKTSLYVLGGLLSSTVLTLAVIPALYALVKEWRLKRGIEEPART